MTITNPSDLGNLQFWVESAEVASSEGSVVSVWTEAGSIDNPYPNDFGDNAYGGARWHDGVTPSGKPVMRFIEAGTLGEQGFDVTTRTTYDATIDPTSSYFAGNAFTIFVLGRLVSASDSDLAQLRLFLGVDFHIDIINFDGAGDWQINARLLNNAVDIAEFSWPYTKGDWVLVELWWDGVTLSALVNGCQLQTAPLSSPLDSDDDPDGRSFMVPGFDPGSVGEMAAIVIYNVTRSPSERADVRAYLLNKYGVDPCYDRTRRAQAMILA